MPDKIIVRGARVHNLKNVSLEIPKNKLVVVTGLSGSGKSSLAFDTIYAEGQRRYAESLSAYARQFMELRDKPDVDEITGLSPTIAIDQKKATQNPRSTVGTVTEMYDALRLLFARVGEQFCPECDSRVTRYTPGQIVEEIRKLGRAGREIMIFAPIFFETIVDRDRVLEHLERAKAREARLDGVLMTHDELESIDWDPQQSHTVELLIGRVTDVKKQNIAAVVDAALELGNGLIYAVSAADDNNISFSLKTVCRTCNIELDPIEPRTFSFNSPYGACPKCTGLGITLEVDKELVIPNDKLTLAEGAIQPWTRITGNQQWYQRLLEEVAGGNGFSVDMPVGELARKAMDILLYGTSDKLYIVDGRETKFEGVITNLVNRHTETNSDYIRKEIEQYMREEICPLCEGRRLKASALSVKFVGVSIADIAQLSVEECLDFFDRFLNGKNGAKNDRPKNGAAANGTTPLELLRVGEAEIVVPIIKEIRRRLDDLLKVGLGYVSIDRSIATLSGGEAQRVRLSTQLSSSLTGVIYILDEPSIGLHPKDREKLVETLHSLRDLGNTIIVVEHDEYIMEEADYVIDVGPGAGRYGGEIIAAGTPAEIKKDKKSLTGAYLSGGKVISAPSKYRKGGATKALTVVGASAFNLKNITAKFPLGKFVCVTGVSGSGKSTLTIDILSRALTQHFYRAKEAPGAHKAIKGIEYIDKVISIDQSAIGRTPRSNPATYTSLFTAIRDLFTEEQEAKLRGYDAGKFSFNVKGGGRCEACAGEGYVRIPMQFLTDVFVECQECHGKRYNREALEIHYRGKNIADVLQMTVEEARTFFRDVGTVADKLQILYEVGLGYIQLGQPATNLSGGEAQRVKLATELSRRATGKTLYILDEPTTGLHFEDIKQLLHVLNQLVDKGNTVIIIEHNMDVIKSADWIIDLGPGGGKHGGEIVAEGTPKEIVKNKASVTGQYLKERI